MPRSVTEDNCWFSHCGGRYSIGTDRSALNRLRSGFAIAKIPERYRSFIEASKPSEIRISRSLSGAMDKQVRPRLHKWDR